MKKSLIMISIATVLVMIITYFVGGMELVLNGLEKSKNTAISSALMLIASFIVIGQLQVLLTKDLMDKWLKRSKGIKAIFISAIAGGLFPGGPYIYYPFISSFLQNDLPFYIFISFIFGKQIYDFSRIPIEVSLVDPNVALIRYLITFPIPLVVGLLAYKFLNNYQSQSVLIKAGEKDDSDNNHN